MYSSCAINLFSNHVQHGQFQFFVHVVVDIFRQIRVILQQRRLVFWMMVFFSFVLQCSGRAANGQGL